jgi:hypothetical protein
MRKSINNLHKFVAVLALLSLGACAGTSEFMKDVAPQDANYATKSDKALVIFMRPSVLGWAISSSVYDVSGGQTEFIAIVPAAKKVAHYSPPGERRFMVVGESADFMSANLEPGKVYYALVTPRVGWWKARFSLAPVSQEKLSTEEFAGWFKGTKWVENKETATGWYRANMGSVQTKLEEYLPKWLEKADKPEIMASDGQPGLYREALAK